MTATREPFTFTTQVGDIARTWSLTPQARERLMREYASYMGWPEEKLSDQLERLRQKIRQEKVRMAG